MKNNQRWKNIEVTEKVTSYDVCNQFSIESSEILGYSMKIKSLKNCNKYDAVFFLRRIGIDVGLIGWM